MEIKSKGYYHRTYLKPTRVRFLLSILLLSEVVPFSVLNAILTFSQRYVMAMVLTETSMDSSAEVDVADGAF